MAPGADVRARRAGRRRNAKAVHVLERESGEPYDRYTGIYFMTGLYIRSGKRHKMKLLR